MNDREEFLQRQKQQGSSVETPVLDIESATEQIAELAKQTCNALVKRGFTMDAAVYLTGKIIPNLI